VRLHDVVGNLRRAIDGARAHGIPVLFAPMAYTHEDYAEHQLHRRSGIHRIQFERRMFLAGSWGADFHPDLQPHADDVVLLPHKGTDVFRTDLPEHLARLGTTHLVLAGMTANLCVESTGRHAAEEGYDVTFLADAIGSENVPSYEAAVRVNFPLIGNTVLEVDEFLAAVAPPSDASIAQPGDTVRGSDHLEIGEVKAVLAATDTHEACLLVPGGLLAGSDTYVPLDAVTKRAGTTVFVNVPRLVVGKMPWDAPPARADRREKEGRPARAVEKLYRSRAPSEHDARGRA
jgi:nicotinamidase-related amidase